MVLSDTDIIQRIGQNELVIDPYDESNVEPASVDLRMGDELKIVNTRYHPSAHNAVALANPDEDEYKYEEVPDMIMAPNELYLGTTKERIEVPDDMVAKVLGRSSLGRVGVSVHQTAGFIDPGFEGQITLELVNEGPQFVQLEPGLRICQIVFEELSSPALNPYGHEGSQYQNQSGATESGMDFE